MKLSFIIPAYNEANYIEDCLSSIFSLQNLPDFEVIVADNNSTDRTAEVVQTRFPEAKLVSEKLKGPAAARNAGARAARGELLAFIDADCRLPQKWWDEVGKGFAKWPGLVLQNGPYKYYDAHSLWGKLSYYISNVWFILLAEFLFRMILRIGGPAFGGNIVVRSGAFIRIGGFNSQFEFYGEDIDLLKRMMKVGKVKFNPQMWVYSSVRRFKKEGQFKMWWVYSINTIWSVLFSRAAYKKHQDIR